MYIQIHYFRKIIENITEIKVLKMYTIHIHANKLIDNKLIKKIVNYK